MKKKIFLLCLTWLTISVQAQLQNDDVWKTALGKSAVRNVIDIPDIDGYKTLKCDFHVHTIFSDGKVWPDVRVDEAWQQGYDAIAMTDHIEYRPFKEQVLGDLNESYKIAKKRADQIGFILISGTEITRSKPLGHLNALFITDANLMDIEDPLKAIDIARSQGAVILWNHPGWPDDKSTMYDVHEKLIAEKKIDMVEVHNHMEYYPLTFGWINQYDLAPSANSDTHDAITNEYGTEKLGRPITLVFAKERSEAAVKEALVARRTAALFDNILVAKKEWAEKLFWASVSYRLIKSDTENSVVEMQNLSDIPFVIQKSENEKVLLPAQKAIRISLPDEATVVIKNIYTGHNQNLKIELPVR